MDIKEAYELVMKEVEALKDRGVKVHITPSKLANQPEIAKQFDDGGLPYEKWKLVTFYPKSKELFDLIAKINIELAQKGICFDTGGGGGRFYWEIDWSFCLEH